MSLRAESGNAQRMHLPHAKSTGQMLDLIEGMDALHRRYDAAPGEQVFGERDELGDFGERARNDAIEFFCWVPGLDPLAHHRDVFQRELGYCFPEKGRLLMVAIQQHHVEIGSCNGDRDPGEPGSTADVEHASLAQVWSDCQTVK